MQNDHILTGAYVALNDLLVLRHLPSTMAAAKLKVVGNRAGSKVSKVKGRGVDFAEVRTYQPGDDIRTIDWRVTARKNKPHTKVFREERERPTLIVVDQSQNMFLGTRLRLKSVAAAEVAARVSWQTLAAGDRVGGVVVGNSRQAVHRPYRTIKSVARFLGDIVRFNNALQREHSEPVASVDTNMMQVRRVTHTNYRIIVISDFAGPLASWREHLHKLARHNQVLVVHVSDPIEQQLPPADRYVVTDGNARLQFYSGDKGLRERYEHRFSERAAALKDLCLHGALSYIALSTTDTELDRLVWA